MNNNNYNSEELQNKDELKKVSILPAKTFNSKNKKRDPQNNKYLENRLEVIGLPTIILPGKKSEKTLKNWVKKEMDNYPETWNGFLVYFDEEPVHNGIVDGYIVKLCNDYEKYLFKFKSKYYKANSHKFSKINGIKSKFNNIKVEDSLINDLKNSTISDLEETMKNDSLKEEYSGENNKEMFDDDHSHYIEKNDESSLFTEFDNHVYINWLTASFNNGIINRQEYLEGINKLSTNEEVRKDYHYNKKFSKYVFRDDNYFEIEFDSIEVLKLKGAYLYFGFDGETGKSKRLSFNKAIEDGDFELAKKYYIEAYNTTKTKLKNVGLTPEQNKFVIDCFRARNFEGINKILNETKDIVGENLQVENTKQRYLRKIKDEKTGVEREEYDNKEKKLYKDPISGNEVLMTRKELHERIIEKFLLEGEASKGKKELILSGGLPGAGKSTIEEALKDVPKVVINPDLVKDYLPEYYDEFGRKFGAEIVHEESSYISKIIYDRAVKGGYTILYDSSMRDKPSENFPKYNKIVQSAYDEGYSIEARFIYDGGESRFRNTILRERTMGLRNYSVYGTAYKTIQYLSKDKRVKKIIIYDNSGNGKSTQAKIVYENQKIDMEKSDEILIKKFSDYQLFLDKLL